MDHVLLQGVRGSSQYPLRRARLRTPVPYRKIRAGESGEIRRFFFQGTNTVTDPYNSYLGQGPVAPAPAAPAASVNPYQPPRIDPIARVDVSDAWKAIFRQIERAGGESLPNFRDLSFSERWRIQTNWGAFFFGPFYYLAKGLWRQTITYMLLLVAVVMILEAMHLMPRGGGVGFGVLWSMRANISYYKRIVLGESPWL